MKKIISILILSTSIVSLIACNKSSDSKSSPDSVQAQKLSDSPTPYPVADADRTKSVDRLMELRKEMKTLEGQLIAPATEDMAMYGDFLKDPKAGLARLFPHSSTDGSANERKPLLVSGGGSYFQFKDKTNEYGYGSDVRYTFYNSIAQFSVGFAGVDFGFLAQLGKTDIRQVNDINPAVNFALSYQSLSGQEEPAWRAEQRKWMDTGIVNNGVMFKASTEAVVGMSYVVRSISEGRYDIAAVFQVIRRDPSDGSLIIAWKLLKEFDKPSMKRD